jgi:hypothetical protein
MVSSLALSGIPFPRKASAGLVLWGEQWLAEYILQLLRELSFLQLC